MPGPWEDPLSPPDVLTQIPTPASPTPTEPVAQTVDTEGPWQTGEPSPASNGRNKPNEEIMTTSATTTVTPTKLPAVTTTEPNTSNNATSRVSTATLVGILIALGAVFVAALAALACIKRKKGQRKRGMRRGRRRGPIDDEDEEEKAPPSYEAAVFGSTDNARWVCEGSF